MSELGELLETLHSPAATFRTVRARIHHTRQGSTGGASPAGRLVIGRRNPAAKIQDDIVETLSLSAVPPDCVRIETERTRDGHTENTVDVSHSDYAWKRYADNTVKRIAKGALPIAFQRHFDRDLIRQIFAALTLEAIGNCHVANRECVRIRAFEVPGSQLWPHWLAWEADEFELAADIDRAVLLSITGKVAGETTEKHEVQELAFDERLDESLFTNEAGEEGTVALATPVVEQVSLAAAISRAPFTVLQPTWLPESDQLQCEVMYCPISPEWADEHLSLCFRGSTVFDHLWINQRSERNKPMHEELQWEVVDVRGRPLNISDPSPQEGLRVVMFEQDGTYIDIISDMQRDELLEVAVSFKAAEA